MKRYSARYSPLSIVAGILILASLTGCSESNNDNNELADTGIDSVDTKLTNWHPILDAPVHDNDSLFLMSLITLKDQGVILEGDMVGPIAEFVRSHGGTENPDSVLLGMTYRQLLDRALVVDLSTEYGYDPTTCTGCNDSILILLPGTDARLFVGKGRKNLQEMIRENLASGEIAEQYKKAPYNQMIDSTNWKPVMDKIASEQKDSFDGVLFGNVLLLLGQEGKDPAQYTYGYLLSVIDRVKEMPEFAEIRTYLANMAGKDSTQ